MHTYFHIEHEIRATYDIKVGQEITINYRLIIFSVHIFFPQKGTKSTFVLFIQIAIEILTAEFFQVHGVRSVAKKNLYVWFKEKFMIGRIVCKLQKYARLSDRSSNQDFEQLLLKPTLF